MKLLATCTLLGVILLLFSFSGLYISFNLTQSSNPVNQRFRTFALRNSSIRRLFKLHQVGDARYELMTQRFLPLEIRLYYQNGLSLEPDTIEQVRRELVRITHKAHRITAAEPVILNNIDKQVDDEQLNAILNMYEPLPRFNPDRIYLNIFVLNSYLPRSSYAGIVTSDMSMFLFKNSIINVSESDSSPVSIETSTILHEFGHLAGADHLDIRDCIMKDTVENLNFYNKLREARETYCQEDIDLIAAAL